MANTLTVRVKHVQRECGWRIYGGVYLEVGFTHDGAPFDSFLRCPAISLPGAWDAKALANKTQLLERPGTGPDFGCPVIYDIVRWIGAENYPYLDDFVQEARYAGISLKIPRNLDFSKITSQSRLMLVHPKAICVPWWRYPHDYTCRWQRAGHEEGTDGPCIYMLRHLILPQHGTFDPDQEAWPTDLPRYRRTLKSGADYYFHPFSSTTLAEGVIASINQPINSAELAGIEDRAKIAEAIGVRRYMPGIFGVFYPTGLTQIKHHDGSFDATVQDRMRASELPTYLDEV